MDILNFLASIIGFLYVSSPPYLINEYIDGLQMTKDPDTYLTTPQIVTRHGYPAETHTIKTSDGFLLQLHRIPYGISGEGNLETRYPILLTHGLIDSSATWVMNGPNRSLAYLLADQGYDVWLMNMRGNQFSMSHANYTPMQHKFWDFSFHEIGIYDTSACIDYILGKTNHEKLLHIGHSIGTSVLYILLSVRPEYNDKLIAEISLAPIYVESTKRLKDWLWAEFFYYGMEYLYWNTAGTFLEHDLLIKLAWQLLNILASFGLDIRDIILYLIFGTIPYQIDQKTMAIFYNNYPAGGSIKCVLQTLQFFNSFSYFNYGPEENIKIYGTSEPPQYNISNVRVPVRLYSGWSDPIAPPWDAARLYEKLPMKAGLVKISDPLFSHLDFVYSKNVDELLNYDVLNFINYTISNAISTTI